MKLIKRKPAPLKDKGQAQHLINLCVLMRVETKHPPDLSFNENSVRKILCDRLEMLEVNWEQYKRSTRAPYQPLHEWMAGQMVLTFVTDVYGVPLSILLQEYLMVETGNKRLATKRGFYVLRLDGLAIVVAAAGPS